MEGNAGKLAPPRSPAVLRIIVVFAMIAGCQSQRAAIQHTYKVVPPRFDSQQDSVAEHPPGHKPTADSPIRLAVFQDDVGADDAGMHTKPESTAGALPADENVPAQPLPITDDSLATLEAAAILSNPKLIGMQQQVNAAWAKTHYVDKLPDPSIGANVFGQPIETAAGSQRANLSIMQMVPWLDRLESQQRQACFEAMAMQQMLNAERLKVTADVRTNYFRLYVLHRQLDTVQGNQELLRILIDVASARVANNQATQSDVLLGTLEFSRLEEDRLSLEQQVASTTAELNRLLNRPADTPLTAPRELQVVRPDWSHEILRQTALQHQPMIAAATLTTSATRWGVEVAELKRRPDFSLSASWYVIDNNRPASAIVGVGNDAWSLGATMTVPVGREKYDAIRDEARWKHAASHADAQDVIREFDARLLDLLQQAQAAAETAVLYRDTIIPQAEQTLRADQAALAEGTVEFDRVIQNVRKLLTLEFGYHRTIGNLAIANARIRQAVGADLTGELLATDTVAERSTPSHADAADGTD
ncbi:MAG: TolC family protein [Planctomycetaceae bacterium]